MSVFPDSEILSLQESICFVDGVSESQVTEHFPTLGGVIKVIQIWNNVDNQASTIAKQLSNEKEEGKITFGLNVYGKSQNAFKKALDIKKQLRSLGRSARCVNKDASNLSTATTYHEWLIRKWAEINILFSGDKILVGKTIAIQDIDAYTKRDTSKSRNMQVGMLPPKLAQMMINLSGATYDQTIYDPFVGLGTILIEAANSGYATLQWSDISPEMVEKSEKNLNNSRFKIQDSRFFELDAARIWESGVDLANAAIVTEWYLGKIFNPGKVWAEEVQLEKEKLLEIYRGFFGWLQQKWFTWTMVITIPFWRDRGKEMLFDEVTDLVNELWIKTSPLLSADYATKLPSRWTYLYFRKDQAVGREIYRLLF